MIEDAVGGVAYQLPDDDEDYCRIITEAFTVTVIWMYREQWIDSDIDVHDPMDHPLDPHRQYSASQWLEAQGLSTLPRRSGPKSQQLLREELERIRQAVALVRCNERKMREALFHQEGQNRGYTDRALVPE